MKIIAIMFTLYFTQLVYSGLSLHEKYPDGLLTLNDYGILTEADLLAETNGEQFTPYDINKSMLPSRRWQCFETKKILFHYSTWRDADPSGPSNIIVTLCGYSFRVTDPNGIHHMYYARRAREVEGCRMAFRKWKKFRRNEKYVCISGEVSDNNNALKGWVWGKIKTKNKCMAYFENECESDIDIK